MKTLITVLISCFSFVVAAQVPEPTMLWLRGYGGNGSVSTIVSKQPDGGFILCLSASASGGNLDSFCSLTGDRAIFMKYNSDASVLEWAKCYHNSATDSGFGYIDSLPSGSYILGGTGNGDTYKFLIHKETATGTILWSKSYGDSASAIMRSMVATGDGGYIILGEINYTNVDFPIHYGSWVNADLGVIKIDSNGNKIWSKVIGGTGDERGWCVTKGPGNGCYIIGTTPSNDYDCTGNHGGDSGTTDAYVVRLDANGNIIWHKDLGGSGYDKGNYGWPDGNGGILVGATSNSNDGDVTHQINSGVYDINMWALDIDSIGNILWNHCYGGGGHEYTNSICKAIDGSIWLAGRTGNKDSFEVDTFYGGYSDAWFVHADSAGNFLSAKVLGSSYQDEGTMVYPMSNGNVIAGGYYDTTGGSFSDFALYGQAGSFLTVFEPQTTGIKSLRNVNEIKVYPNPANEFITIAVEQKGNYSVVINDLIGNLVYKSEVNDKLQIQIASWQKGLYIMQVISRNDFIEVQKLIVE